MNVLGPLEPSRPDPEPVEGPDDVPFLIPGPLFLIPGLTRNLPYVIPGLTGNLPKNPKKPLIIQTIVVSLLLE